MSTRRTRRRRQEMEYVDAELNIMPFIDVFSVLNTFLLLSAVFVAFGVVRVQIPFFTNKQSDDKPKRSLEIKVDARVDKIILTTNYSLPPRNETNKDYLSTPTGLEELHQALVQLRSNEPEADLVTVFADDEVTYDQFIQVVDAVKYLREGDPEFENKVDENDIYEQQIKSHLLYPKVVIGSVVL